MFELISNVVYFVLLTIVALIALDYFFGTDKFESFRKVMFSEIPLIAGTIAILIFGTVYWLLYIAYDGDNIFLGLLIVYQSVVWVGIWLFYTLYFTVTSLFKLRKKNLEKRKKPH